MSVLDPSSGLPLEVWERIIDLCVVGDTNDGRTRYKPLLSCALTCRSWLPRSRYHIFHIVAIHSDVTLHYFFAALNSNPALCNLIIELQFNRISDYHFRIDWPDRWLLVLANLTHLRTLTFNGDSEAVRRLQYGHTLYAQFAPVTTLRLHRVTFATLEEFERLMLAFPSLTHLDVLANSLESILPYSAAKVPSIAHSPSWHLRLTTLSMSWSFPQSDRAIMTWLTETTAVSSLVHFNFISNPVRVHSDEKTALTRLLQSCAGTLETVLFSSNMSRSYYSLKLSHNNNLHTLRLNTLGAPHLSYIAAILATVQSPRIVRVVLTLRACSSHSKVLNLDWNSLHIILIRPNFDSLTAFDVVCDTALTERSFHRDAFQAQVISGLPALQVRGILHVSFT